MESYSTILRHLRKPRIPKVDEWSEFTHRPIKVENPNYKGLSGGTPPFVKKWLIEYNGKPIAIKESLAEVNLFYGKGTSR